MLHATPKASLCNSSCSGSLSLRLPPQLCLHFALLQRHPFHTAPAATEPLLHATLTACDSSSTRSHLLRLTRDLTLRPALLQNPLPRAAPAAKQLSQPEPASRAAPAALVSRCSSCDCSELLLHPAPPSKRQELLPQPPPEADPFGLRLPSASVCVPRCSSCLSQAHAAPAATVPSCCCTQRPKQANQAAPADPA